MSTRRRTDADEIRHIVEELTHPLNEKVHELEDENIKLRKHVEALRTQVDDVKNFGGQNGEEFGGDLERRVSALEQKNAKVMRLCQSIDSRLDDVVLIYQDKGRLDNLTAQAEEFKRQFYRVEEFAVRLSALEIEFKKSRGPLGKTDLSTTNISRKNSTAGNGENDSNMYSLDYRVRMLEHKVNQLVKHRPDNDRITSLSNEMRTMQAQFNQMNQSLNQVQFDDQSSLFNLSEYGNDDREVPERYDRDDEYERRLSTSKSSKKGSPKRGSSSPMSNTARSAVQNTQVQSSYLSSGQANPPVQYQGDMAQTGDSRSINAPVIYPNGSVVYPNGSVVHPSGPVVYPNGSVVYPNGPIVYPNTPQTFASYNGEVTNRDLDEETDSDSETEPPIEHHTATVQITTQELNLISKEEFDDELAKLKDFLEQRIVKVSDALKSTERVCMTHTNKQCEKVASEQVKTVTKFKENFGKLSEQVRKQDAAIKDNTNAIASTNKALKDVARQIEKNSSDILQITDAHKKLSETQRFANQSNVDFIEKVNKDLQEHKVKLEKVRGKQEKDFKQFGTDFRTVAKSLDDTRSQVQQQLLSQSQRISEIMESNNRQFEAIADQVNQTNDKIEANFERHERNISNLSDRIDKDLNETYKAIDRVEQASQQQADFIKDLDKDTTKLRNKLKESNEALAQAVDSMKSQQKDQKQQFKVIQDAINQKCNDTIDICNDKIEDFKKYSHEDSKVQILELKKQCESITHDLEKRTRQLERNGDKYNRMTEKHDTVIFDKIQPIVENVETHVNKANEQLDYHSERIEELLELKQENAEMKEKLDHIIINQVHTTVDALRKVDEGSSKRSPKYKPDLKKEIEDIRSFSERNLRRNNA